MTKIIIDYRFYRKIELVKFLLNFLIEDNEDIIT